MNKLHRVSGTKPPSFGSVTFDVAPALGLAGLALLFPLGMLFFLYGTEHLLSAVRYLFAV
ncbi:hypothetical protein [Collimonas sp. OK412]|jgi:hypothetical protein|uniref:hypothetical protein n=1 Tax=Collimonas sp. (strain OK412) TaxID=1801619 RepID=UPI0008F457F3|nr:hypothetical protein [Collimonas sp. OK412]SFD35505.1 hypothetical protein SAMN04515619_1442 [Collimonas sp. OK412]